MTRLKKIIPLILLILLLISNFIYSRPIALRSILELSKESITTNNYVNITEWNKSKQNIMHFNLSEEEFNDIMNLLDKYNFRRTFPKNYYSSTDVKFYIIEIEYSLKEDEKETFRIASDRRIEVGDKTYEVIDKDKAWVETIQKIFDYVTLGVAFDV